MSFSISLTHIFIFLTCVLFILFLISEERERKKNGLGLYPMTFPGYVYAGILLFTWMFITSVIHYIIGTVETHQPNAGSYFYSVLFKGELSDLWLFVFGWMVYILIDEQSDKEFIHKAILITGIILILSGFIAMFSEFRLSHILSGAGYVASAENRPQHPALSMGGFLLYQPIGFMNTRLTYAGLLILVLPLMVSTVSRTGALFMPDRPLLERSFFVIMVILGFVVLIMNRSRSAIFALGFAVFTVMTLHLLSMFFSGTKPADDTTQKQPPRGRAQLVSSVMVMAVFLFVIALVIFTKIVSPAELAGSARRNLDFAFRHTDWQRNVIWKASGDIIRKSPYIGVGPGQFKEAVGDWKTDYVSRHPDTLYFIMNTPDGHAHNDLLHIFAIGGFPAVILFLMMIALIIQLPTIARITSGETYILLIGGIMGIMAFFSAGLFQCYFQDDEVVGFFWVLTGFLFTYTKPMRHERSFYSMPS